MRRRLLLLLLPLSLTAATCGGYGHEDETSPPPSGSLGPVTAEAADEAILGLCALVGETDPEAAEATFVDRSHRTLHVIAAAAEAEDRAAAGRLLEAKQVVEADLQEDDLPAGFPADVEALLEAANAALATIGLESTGCEA